MSPGPTQVTVQIEWWSDEQSTSSVWSVLSISGDAGKHHFFFLLFLSSYMQYCTNLNQWEYVLFTSIVCVRL